MKLFEMLRQLDKWPEEMTVYLARPWSSDAEAILASPTSDIATRIEQGYQSYDYFLEVALAREFLEAYAETDEGAKASEQRRCERLISYAHYDA